MESIFDKKFCSEYKNILDILKIHSKMPEKYKKYIFYMIAKDIKLKF